MFKRLLCTNYDNLFWFFIFFILQTSCVPTFSNDQTKTKQKHTRYSALFIVWSLQLKSIALHLIDSHLYDFRSSSVPLHTFVWPRNFVLFIFKINPHKLKSITTQSLHICVWATIYWMKAGQMVINRFNFFFFFFRRNILLINQNQKFNRE